MKDFRKELYRKFGRYKDFIPYYRHTDQDGNYASFGAFGDLLHDILKEKIVHRKLLLKQCAFIDEISAENDPEWNNILKMEIFSMMNNKELLKLQELLSEDSNRLLRIYLVKENRISK